MTDKEMLDSMKVLFGDNVMYTDGLYHIMNADHSEIYINPKTKETDKRCKYSTLVVMDNIVVARVLNLKDVNFVILSKDNLDCIYKTTGEIFYIDENIIYDKINNLFRIISHTGKKLMESTNIESISIVDDRKYLIKSHNSFNDTIAWYRPQLDILTSLAKNKRYLIYKCNKYEDAVEVVSMQGGKYIYRLRSNKCINMFTEKVEDIQLFDALT